MSAIESPSGKVTRQRRPGSASSTSVFERSYADPAKTLVMAHIGRLVAEGFADWRPLADDEIELSLAGGEVFVLGKILITRIL